MNSVFTSVLCMAVILFQGLSPSVTRGDTKQILENDRTIIWDVTSVDGAPSPVASSSYDRVVVYVAGGAIKTTLPDGTSTVATRKPGDVVFESKGETERAEGASEANPVRSIVVALKDYPVPPLANTSGYPNAFPRPGSIKVLENNRVVIWDYTWMPNKPTPMHFHDKDAVVISLNEGSVKSTLLNGQSTVGHYSLGQARFNARDRVHTEELVSGEARAIIVELK